MTSPFTTGRLFFITGRKNMLQDDHFLLQDDEIFYMAMKIFTGPVGQGTLADCTS